MVREEYYVIFKRLLFSMAFFVIYRVLFGVYNYKYFEGIDYLDLFKAFILGFRFDIASVLITNLFFILFSIIPFRSIWYKKLLKFIFVLFNFVFISILVIDLEFFSFIGKKVTFDIFDLSSDIQNQSLQLIINYWYFILLIFFNLFLLSRYYPRVKKNLFPANKIKLPIAVVFSFFLLILSAIGIRGGIQLRSLSPKNAFVFDRHELGNLALNAAYSMTRSIGKKGLKSINYFKDDNAAKEFIRNHRTYNANFKERIELDQLDLGEQNVVLIILESFSQEYIEQGYAPFLSQLAKESLYYKNSFANGRRSIEALPSIMTGFPSLIDKPLSQSQYQANNFYALPETLKNHGYQTSFYHGGKKGTMDFDAYCSSIGFDEYHAKEDYPNQDHFDGQWGIFDHHFYNYFKEKLDKTKTPFFTGFFSLSSHQPYTIPKGFKNKFNKGELEIHESIGYADESLKLFFESAQKSNWFKNTLFIITADHTQKLLSKKYNSDLGRYRVPILFYHPRVNLNAYRGKKFLQQADILPTTLDFLGLKSSKSLLFGSSALSKNDSLSLNYINGSHFMMVGNDEKNSYIRFDGQSAQYYFVSEDYLDLTPAKEDQQLLDELNYLKLLKAYIQYTNNGLKKNRIYQ